MSYIFICYFERSSFAEVRVFMAELFIFYFCVAQMFTSSLWIRELVCCNLSLLIACIGMFYHMREPRNEKEEEEFAPVETHATNIILIWTSFVVFTVVNRFIIEKRERYLFLAKSVSQ